MAPRFTSLQLGGVLQVDCRAASPAEDVRRRHHQSGRPRAVREVLPQLHAQAVGPRSRPSSMPPSPRGCRCGPTATIATSPTPIRRCRCTATRGCSSACSHHPNIKVLLNTDYREIEGSDSLRRGDLHRADRRVLRLPVRAAALPIAANSSSKRSTRRRCQPVAVVNYPNDQPLYARHRVQAPHRTGSIRRRPASTSIRRPKAIRTIPIPRPENAALYRKYQELGAATAGVHFVGRLGTYKYYNMDQVVAQALTTFAKIAGVRRSDCVTA